MLLRRASAITSGSWKNWWGRRHNVPGLRYVESFNGKLRDELLNVEVFDTLWEAKVLAERWRREYNQRRPHSAVTKPVGVIARFVRRITLRVAFGVER